MKEQVYVRGQIYYISPEGAVGSEQMAGRPAIIVSNDVGNEFSNCVEVVYLTTRDKPDLPTHVAINSCTKPSIALCEQICTVDKARIGKYVNEISMAETKKLDAALLVSLQINTTLRGSKALEVWRKAMEEDVAQKAEQVKPGGQADGESLGCPATICEEGMAEDDLAYQHAIWECGIYKQLYAELVDRLFDRGGQ